MMLSHSIGPDYQLLQMCRDQVRAELPLSKWDGSERKWREVTERKAWKRYQEAPR